MESFSVKIVTPEKLLYEGTAKEVIAPGKEGALSILSRHAPVLAALRGGQLIVKNAEGEKKFDASSGFLEVSKKDTAFVNIFAKEVS